MIQVQPRMKKYLTDYRQKTENLLSHESEKRNLEDEITKLKDENADLIAQLEKLKRVLTVMDKQLKLIKGKK